MLCIPNTTKKSKSIATASFKRDHMKRSRSHPLTEHVLAAHMLSSGFGYSLALVSIKLHLQVHLCVQNASHHCDWNSKVSLALGTDCHCGHRPDPLDYTQSALIGRHLRNILRSLIAHHTVLSSFKLTPKFALGFVAEMSQFVNLKMLVGRAGAKLRGLQFPYGEIAEECFRCRLTSIPVECGEGKTCLLISQRKSAREAQKQGTANSKFRIPNFPSATSVLSSVCG